MPEPRLAKSLVHLREQINVAAPGRNKTSDGWIGDTSHQARKSDHNPDAEGYVYAFDVTNDPAHGVVSQQVAEELRRSKDPRLQYVISNKRIANMDIEDGAWRPYAGSNPHDKHCHVSVRHDRELRDDTRDWKLPQFARDISAPEVPEVATIHPGAPESATVNELKEWLVKYIESEKGYGVLSEAVVRAYQKERGLAVDGIVGPYTWASLHKGVVES